MSPQGDQLPAPDAGEQDIEQVLLGLADGSYVLSTPDGAVAECGLGVVGLLGAPADRLVGRPTAEVLVPGADDAVRKAFDELLRADGADLAAPRTFRAQAPGGAARSLQFVVVAVPLALGWEFTSLLSELGSRDAGTWHPDALRLRHGRALEAIEGVVRDRCQPDPSARLAGILIVVRDVDAPQLTREDVERRMSEQREAARAAAAEAARRKDEAAGRAAPGPGAKSENQLPGLEDLVERARLLRERLEEAEHDVAAANAEREEALGRLAQAEAERDAAAARAVSAQAAGDARAELLTDERNDALARLQDARRELESAVAAVTAARRAAATAEAELAAARAAAEAAQGELVSARADAQEAHAEARSSAAAAQAAHAEAESAREELRVARAEAGSARDELHAVRAALDAERAAPNSDAELVALRAETEAAQADAEALRAELQAARAELQAARGESALARGEAAAVGGELQSTRNDLQSARAELDARGGELAGLRGELETTRAELERTRGELDASQSAAADVRADREQVKLRAQQLLHEAERARAAADAIRAEFAFDPESAGADALPPHATPADGERSPWSVPVTSDQPAPPAAPALPDVEPGQAAALISLDGQFRRLDEAFCSLLGCREEDLRAARWPSIIDRENLEPHQEIARALKAGEIRSAEIETVYMHAQGLLVPIAGTVSLHRADPGGEPTHFLFRADVSRTSGVPGIL